jgi:signal transduction histidine kinase/CheY-like chemotaxis protein
MPYRNSTICILLFLLSVMVGWTQEKESGEWLLDFYDPEDYQGAARNNCILIDQRGQLLLGNSNVIAYSGLTWNAIRTGNINNVTSLAMGEGGSIWVGGAGQLGLLERGMDGSFVYKDLTEEAQQVVGVFKEIWSIYHTPSGVFFVSVNTVLQYHNGQWQTWFFSGNQRILSHYLGGKLYIHNRGDGIYQYDVTIGDFKLYSKGEDLSGLGITFMADIGDHGLLCATNSGGLYTFNEGEFNVWPTANDDDLKSAIISSGINLQSGGYALGTLFGGIYLLSEEGELRGQISKNEGEKLGMVYDLVEDDYGGIWAALQHGLVHIPHLPVASFSEGLPSQHTQINDLLRYQDTLYVSTDTGIYTIEKDASSYRLKPREPLNIYSRNLSLCGDQLLSASYNQILVYEGMHLKSAHPNYGNMGYLELSRHASDRAYLCGYTSLTLWENDGALWQEVDFVPHVEEHVNSLRELSSDELLYSVHNGGVWRLKKAPGTVWSDGEYEIIDLYSDLSDTVKWLMFFEVEGSIYALSRDGIYAYDVATSHLSKVHELEEPISDYPYVHHFTNDFNDDKKVFLSVKLEDADVSNAYVVYAIAKDGNGILVEEVLNLPRLSDVGEVNALFAETIDGACQLWVGGTGRAFRYKLGVVDEFPTPEAYIGDMQETASGTRYSAEQSLEPLSYPQHTLRFSFAVKPWPYGAIGFESKLVNWDHDWVDSGGHQHREFTQLPEGDYTFELRAYAANGLQGPITRVYFTILPPWYRTYLAYAFYLIAIMLIAYSIIQWRTQILLERNRSLEALVSERTLELERKNMDLHKSNRAKQDFLQSISHEIRNPMNAILGLSEIIHRNHLLDDTDPQMSRHLHVCSIQLSELLNEVLDSSALEAGGFKINTTVFDPLQLLIDVLDMHVDLATQKGLIIEKNIPELNYYWVGDRNAITRILINLISNAIKYTHTGTVSVTLTYQTEGDSIDATFSVADTGPGIPSRFHEAIFSPFTRLTDISNVNVTGTGLGLSIAASVAKLLGGHISLQSVVGRGSCFSLQLQLARGEKKLSSANSETLPNVLLRDMRVLVADDFDFNNYMTATLLQSLGAVVDQAENGYIALQKMQAIAYDYILLDIRMPELTGIEVIQRYWQQAEAHKPRLMLALTAYSDEETVLACLDAGFDFCFSKPLRIDDLLGAMSSICTPHSTLYKSDSKRRQIPLSGNLLDYLGSNNENLQQEVSDKLQEAIEGIYHMLIHAMTIDNSEDFSTATHRLKGISRMIPDYDIIQLANDLSHHREQHDFKALVQVMERFRKDFDITT